MAASPATRWLTSLRYVDDESEDESSSASSPAIAPVARRPKFDDEEDDSDVRFPVASYFRLYTDADIFPGT